MDYVINEDGTYQATVTVAFKPGDQAYLVTPERNIKVVNIKGLRVSTYVTKRDVADSLILVYVTEQVGVATAAPQEVQGSKLFKSIELALAAATAA